MKRLASTMWILAFSVAAASASDLHVDPITGDDLSDGRSVPVKTIARAIRLAAPGDTIHLRPVTYRDWAAFHDKAGEPDKPITLDGHGATLDGCDPLDPDGWIEIEPGLFRHDDLLPLTDAIIDRWFILWEGRMNRMHRCSKGPGEPLKSPESLAPGEWTFVKDAERSKAARTGYIHGSFFLRLSSGQKLGDAGIQIPHRPAGVLMHGACRHLIVRNLTCTHPYNDGFNLSDCRDIVFRNIRAIDCGDDGISAHGECSYQVDGLTSIGNATGICDTGASETSYRQVLIERCIGFDLYFLDTGRYSVSDAHIRSSAVRPLYLLGREPPETPCTVTLDNVWLERVGGESEVRVSPNCRLTVSRSTFTGLDWQATGGELSLERCVISGTLKTAPPRQPRLHLWPAARWSGKSNRYSFSSIRVAQQTFTQPDQQDFFNSVNFERDSRWSAADPDPEDGIGFSGRDNP